MQFNRDMSLVSVSQKSRMFLQGAILLILIDVVCWNKTSWRFQCSTKSPVFTVTDLS